ncbi:peptidylprolyl isomerase [Polymorphospora rubra]|uniref:peptidylprolyl isomerase n=1 Tax=Polymorphospora rubra TaxID=338584 RepID=UPI0033E53B72
MASSKDRQRKLARAKLDRQMARRAAGLRRRRRIQAGVGAAAALVLIVVGSFWALGGFDRDPGEEQAGPPQVCTWTPQNAANNPSLKEVGTPSATDVPTTGTRPMTVTTNQGAPITVDLDLTNAPCAGASFAHLAGQGFFDNTTCHEITNEGALLCGDHSGTGAGGPSYTFFNENVPPLVSESPAPDAPPLYPAGTVALMGTPPGANGSQFLIFFQDYTTAEPMYPIVGRVTSGQDVVDTIGKMETVDNGLGAKVKPATDVLIQSLTVGEVTTAPPAPDLTDTPPATPPTASPSAAGQS